VDLLRRQSSRHLDDLLEDEEQLGIGVNDLEWERASWKSAWHWAYQENGLYGGHDTQGMWSKVGGLANLLYYLPRVHVSLAPTRSREGE